MADGLILETRGLTRRFGGLLAVNDVSLALHDGGEHVLPERLGWFRQGKREGETKLNPHSPLNG